jgi:hypothetical protein
MNVTDGAPHASTALWASNGASSNSAHLEGDENEMRDEEEEEDNEEEDEKPKTQSGGRAPPTRMACQRCRGIKVRFRLLPVASFAEHPSLALFLLTELRTNSRPSL